MGCYRVAFWINQRFYELTKICRRRKIKNILLIDNLQIKDIVQTQCTSNCRLPRLPATRIRVTNILQNGCRKRYYFAITFIETMRDLTLFRAMINLPSSVNLPKPLKGSTANSQDCLYIERGHVMEFIEVNSKKIVCLFFGPGEFAIKCHPDFSNLHALDEVKGSQFSSEAVIKLLRKFPETFEHYRVIRKRYYEKIAERLRIQEMQVEKRLEHLQKTQPWVFDLVDPKDIACYLGISLGIFEKLTK